MAKTRSDTATGEALPKVSGRMLSKLLRSEGGAINPDALRKKGLLISVNHNGEHLYPLWQFERQVYPHLKTILKELDADNATKLAFFLTHNRRLNNSTPLQALRKGWVGKVVMAARNFKKDDLS